MIPPDDVRRLFAEYFGLEPDAIPMGWTSMMDELAVAMEEMTKGIRGYLPAGPEVRGLLEGGDGGVMGLLGWDAPTEQELDVEPEGAAPEQAGVPIGLARHVAAGMSAEDASHLAEMMRTPAQPREESQPEPTPEQPVEQKPAQPKSEWEERDDLDADLEEPFDPNETEGAWRPRESGGAGMENANGEVAYDWKEEDGLLVAEEDGEIISGERENFQDEADEALGNITEALPSAEGNAVYLQTNTLEPGKAPTKLVVFGESAQTIAGALDAANVSYRDNFDSIEEKMEEGKETRDGDPYDESHFKLTISGKKNVQAAIQALVGDNGDYGVLVLQDESGSLRFMLNPKSVDMEGVTTLEKARAENERLKQEIEEENRKTVAAWEARTGLKYDPEWREHIVRPDGPFREVDGSTIREGTIRNGEWDGEVREYRDGVLRKTAIYKNGNETGTRKLYRGDGTLALDRFFNEDGNAVEIHYGKDGKTEEYRLVRGKRGVVLFDSRNQPQEAPVEPAAQPEPEQKPSAKTKAFERVREPVGEHGAYMEGIKENGHWVGEVKHFPAANDKLPAMIEHYDGLGRLERIQTMYSTDRSKVYTETFYYADGTSLQTMFAPNGDRVRSVSIDVNGRETILYSRAQERLRRRIEEAKDNKYFPKESIDWELLMSDKDGMQLADDLLFYVEDRERQDDMMRFLGKDNKERENARKRAQAKLREAKKKALALQEELQKRRGQAGNTALSVGGFGLNANARAEMEKVRKQYEGTDKWMKAPNGKPTKLNERQWLQVRTPSFKAWFGDWENDPANASKVVDENGEPLVVYHGSQTAGFAVFNKNKGDRDNSIHSDAPDGSNWFSDKRGVASTYSNSDSIIRLSFDDIEEAMDNNALKDVYVIVDENNIPLEGRYYEDYDDAADWADEETDDNDEGHTYTAVPGWVALDEWMYETDTVFADEDAALKYANEHFHETQHYPANYAVFLNIRNPKARDFGGKYWHNDHVGEDVNDVAGSAQLNGFDGAIIRNVIDEGGAGRGKDEVGTDYIVFDPNAIKSATDNVGTFDPENPDIRLSVGSRMGKWEADPGFAAVRPAEVGRQRRAGAYYPDIGGWLANTAFSIGERRKAEYRAVIGKKRPDLPSADVDAFMGEMDKLGDTKAEKAALHWFVKGGLQLPEDGEKLGTALKTAAKFKLDPFAFGSPDELLAEADRRNPKKQVLPYIDPDTVPELTNRRDLGHGVVVYDVEDSEAGQAAMRRIMNSHLGREANGRWKSPWCLLTATDAGEVSTSAKKYWKQYSKSGRGAAFYNGRLVAFQSSKKKKPEWWDLKDNSHGESVPIPPGVRKTTTGEIGVSADNVPADIEIAPAWEMLKTGELRPLLPASGERGSVDSGLVEAWNVDTDGAWRRWVEYYTNGTLTRRTDFAEKDDLWYKKGKASGETFYQGDMKVVTNLNGIRETYVNDVRKKTEYLAMARFNENPFTGEPITHEPPAPGNTAFSVGAPLEIPAASLKEAQAAIRILAERHTKIKMRNGDVLQFSAQSNKMHNSKAVHESDNAEAHFAAVAAIKQICEAAEFIYDEPPRNNSSDILYYRKYATPVVVDGQGYIAKLTAKVYPQKGSNNVAYSIEAISLERVGDRGINDAITKGRQHLDPIATEKVAHLVNLVKDYLSQGKGASRAPGNTALSVGSRPGPAPTAEPGGDVREAGEGTLAWLRRKFVHSQTPVFDAVRRVMGVGREPPDALNVEAAAKNVHGKIRARQEMLQRAYLEPLKAILAQPGMDRKRFDDYALALHALERNRMIQERSVVVDPTSGEVVDLGVEAGSGVTNAWAERMMREVQRDPFAEQYKEAANILAEMNRFVLRGAVADGLLTEAQARTWMRLSPHYVPLKSGGAAPGAIHKRATGRFTRPDSVLVNSMRQAYATVRNGELNRVNKTMADWIREYDPNGEQVGGTVPESHKHAKIKMADPQYVPKGSTAEALLRERGIRLVETEDKGGYWVDTGVLPNALKRVVRESVPQGDDIVTFWENGERKFIRFEGKRGRDGTAENEAARIADALNFKNVLHKEGRFWDLIRGATRWKANVSTSWNPTFIVRNMGADVFNTANLMMIEGKYAELARTMRNYPEALNRVERSSHAWVSFTDGVFPLAEAA